MPTLHVCPLSKLNDTAAQIGASHVVTLVTAGTSVERPPMIQESCHLSIHMSDIVEPLDGHVLPAAEHVERLLHFVRGWERESPLLFHCWAGISRSTAAAYITACALTQRSESQIAWALREASPTATPNARLVALADDMLGRRGRMVDAVRAIGRGAEAFEGTPFTLKLS